jgi:hypothetical protein
VAADICLTNVWDKKYSLHQENILYVNLYQYNQTYLYPKLNGYRNNDEIIFKEGIQLYIYCLPNTCHSEVEFAVSVI